MRNYKWPENNQFLGNICAAMTAHPGGFVAFRQIIPNDVNISDSNLVWNPGGPVMVECRVVGRDEAPNKLLWELWQKEGFDLKSVVADPKFTNPNTDDYRPRDDSPAFRLGFPKIPLERIGLYQSELRASWPVPRDARPPMSLARAASRAGVATPAVRARFGAVVTVPRTANAPAIDGKIDLREWAGATGIVLQADENGNPAALKSFASLMYDDDFLYIALLNYVDPKYRLSVTGHWGADDAAEVAIRNPLNRIPNIILVRGYPTGQHTSSMKAGCSPEVASRVGELTQYEAHQIDGGRWSCEWALPWIAMRYDLRQHTKFDLNLTVRKAASKLWLMWQPTGGEGWALDKAGAIVVGK